MLATLSAVKSRLGILDTDTQYDALLTSAIRAVSARFDKETNRTLARTTAATDEFETDQTEILVSTYPVESVSKFELKTDETSGWVEQPGVKFLIRRNCIISLPSPLSTINSQPSAARVAYAAGYVLPGTTPGAGQTPLPDDLEHAAVEQVAFWFQTRDKLGIRISWPSGGEYKQFSTLDLLPSVSAVLAGYRRIQL